MFNNKSNSQSHGRKVVENSFHRLATVVALIAVLAASIPIFEAPHEPICDNILDAYREEVLAQLGVFGTLVRNISPTVARVIPDGTSRLPPSIEQARASHSRSTITYRSVGHD